jgi:hypothetical protein
VSDEEQTVVKASAQINWRKLLMISLLVMVLPTLSAMLLDVWFATRPIITIAAIVICFPTATIMVVRIALSEMDRVIAEVTPLQLVETEPAPDIESLPEVQSEGDSSPTS